MDSGMKENEHTDIIRTSTIVMSLRHFHVYWLLEFCLLGSICYLFYPFVSVIYPFMLLCRSTLYNLNTNGLYFACIFSFPNFILFAVNIDAEFFHNHLMYDLAFLHKSAVCNGPCHMSNVNKAWACFWYLHVVVLVFIYLYTNIICNITISWCNNFHLFSLIMVIQGTLHILICMYFNVSYNV